MSMADRIVIMKDGEIIQVGTPEDVYFRSADMFVAGFIGTPPTNFFPVSLNRTEEKPSLGHPHFTLPMEKDVFASLTEGGREELILGVRPEDFIMVSRDESILDAEVLVTEPQGSHQILAVEIENQIMKIVLSSDVKLKPGDPVHFRFDEKRLHFFDKDTEKRII